MITNLLLYMTEETCHAWHISKEEFMAVWHDRCVIVLHVLHYRATLTQFFSCITAARITLFAPSTLVFIASKGLRSRLGTCFKAAYALQICLGLEELELVMLNLNRAKNLYCVNTKSRPVLTKSGGSFSCRIGMRMREIAQNLSC